MIPGTLLSAAVRKKRFWIVLVVVTLAAFGVGGALPNMESILKSKTLSTVEIRSIVPITGMAMVVGRLGSSYLIDRLWAPAVAFAMLVTASLGFLYLAFFVPTPRAAAGVVITIGLTVGMEADVAAFLVARYFGARHFGSIYGCIYGAFAVGTGLGAVSYGMAFDRFADYHAALLSSGLILIASGALLLTLGRYIFPVTPARVRST
jgi:predicted MFS family arabinose efflux permease